jgi:hypothetical protein
MNGPHELLAHRVHHQRIILRLGKFIHLLAPQRKGKSEEQDHFHNDDTDLRVRREFRVGSVIVGLRIAPFAEAPDHVEKEGRPPDEEKCHERVHHTQHVVQHQTVMRCVSRYSKPLVDHIAVLFKTSSKEFVIGKRCSRFLYEINDECNECPQHRDQWSEHCEDHSIYRIRERVPFTRETDRTG